MNPIAQELVSKLEADPQLNFKKKKGKYLSEGTCPSCGKAEAFISREEPWLLSCNRANNCGYSESTRERYAELFESFTERFPVTQDDPDAPARAYLTYNRGFRATKVSGWYAKGIRTLFKDRKRIGEVLTVRFPLWGEHYWERIIDRKDIERNNGKKAHISYGCDFKDKGWTPPEQVIEKGDWVFITEGIFKSIALIHLDPADLAWPLKTIAALSSSNLPRDFIGLHKGKGITWVLAYDNDPAGLKAMDKFQPEIEAMGEKVSIALGKPDQDWDDEWRAGKLNQVLLDNTLWQGAVTFASSAREAAFWQVAKNIHFDCHRFTFRKAMYVGKLDDKEKSDLPLNDLGLIWARDAEISTKELYSKIAPHIKVRRIANCFMEFLYVQREVISEEQLYYFNIQLASNNPERLIGLEGSALESPSALNKVLLNRTVGGSFTGSHADLEYFRDRWFGRKACQVHSIAFIGYDPDSEAYVFPQFGYHKGHRIPVNAQGYLCVPNHNLKTSLKTREFTLGDGQLDWGEDFIQVFHFPGMTALAWWLGSLFAEQIRAAQQTWPFLELTGDQGAGKSSLLEFLWRCLGIANEEGFDPEKSTPAGRARKLVQLSNLPCVLIEGDREGKKEKSYSWDMDELKTAFNGRIIRATGTKSNDSNTDEKPFRGAICISQNATVTGSKALLSRIVHCHCTREHHTDAAYEIAKSLMALPVEKVATFMDQALRMEKPLLEAYFTFHSQLEAVFRERFPKMQNRLVLNHSQVAAWSYCLPMLFGNREFSNARLKELTHYLMLRAEDRERRLDSDPPNLRLFWEIYDAYNVQVDSISGMESNRPLFNHSNNDKLIAIHLVDFERICNEQRLPRIDYAQLEAQLPNSQHYAFIGKRNVKSKILGNGRTRFCWVFNAHRQTHGGGVKL